MMRSAALFVLVLASALLPGCGGVGFKGGPTATAGPGNDWPFIPTSMRVHPFTSLEINESEGGMILEVRMELLDQLGDPTKGVGDFRFELYASPSTASREGQEKRLFFWEAPMTTLEQNRQHYDPITRTYAFNLRMPDAPPANEKLKLVVQFTDARGHRLVVQSPLSVGAHRKVAPPAP